MKKHIHQYRRVKIGAKYRKVGRFKSEKVSDKIRVYACALPDCSHYVHEEAAQLLIGKVSKCNYCFKPFIMDKTSIGLARPRCQDCKKQTVKQDKIALVNEFLGGE